MLVKNSLALLAAALAVVLPAIASPMPSNNNYHARYESLYCMDKKGGHVTRSEPVLADGCKYTDGQNVRLRDTPGGEQADDCPLGTPSLINTLKVDYLSPGQGACSFYRDSSMTACLDSSWQFPNGTFPCGLWVEVKHAGKTVQLRVDDKCPGSGCSGLFISKRAMQILGGDEAIKAGNLPPGTVEWKFLDSQPWWSCWAGLAGNRITGEGDDCGPQSYDPYGCPRDGRKHGSERVVGEKVYTEICPNYSLYPKGSSNTGSTSTEVFTPGSTGKGGGSSGSIEPYIVEPIPVNTEPKSLEPLVENPNYDL